MTILHSTTFLQGGAGRVLTDLACAQKSSGENVIILTDNNPIQGYESYPLYLERLHAAHITVIELSSFFHRDLVGSVSVSEQVRTIISDYKVKLIHAHSAIPAMIALLARSSAKHFVPLIMSMQGFGTNKTKNQVKTDVAIMNLVDKVVPVSQASFDLLESIGVNYLQLQVIHNAIPEVELSDIPLIPNREDNLWMKIEHFRKKNIPIIGCIGSIGERKNQHCLVQALSKIKNQEFVCLLIGDEEKPGELSRVVKKLKLEKKVIVTSYRSDAQAILKKLTCLVLPSRSEGLPLSIIEAFREGVPVIASNISSIKELVYHQTTGLLFNDNKYDDLAEKLTHVLDNPVDLEILVSNGKQLFKEKFTLKVMLQQYQKLYDSLLK